MQMGALVLVGLRAGGKELLAFFPAQKALVPHA
jgi:hypothetical protein